MGDTPILTAFSIHLVLSGSMGCIVFVPPPRPPTSTPTTQPATTSASTEASCVCGVPNSNDRRIVGGQPAEKNEYPWLVRLVRRWGTPLCGGSLISSNTVLTAAHCYRDPSTIRAVVQDHDVTQDDGEIKIDVSLFITHPNYDSSTNQFDFAIVRLVQHVTFSKTISPVCLPRIGQNYEQREAVVTGWGTLESFGSSPNILQEVELTILTNKQCTTNTQYLPFQITDDMICAAKPGKDSCQGDSGGPLLGYEGGGRYLSVVGLVSWGYGCALPDAPGVYARVKNQLDWIRDKIEGSTCPTP